MTIREAIREAFETLNASPHPDRARQDAEFLLMHVLNCGRAQLLTRSDESLSPEALASYHAVIQQRSTGKPVQYITGSQEFYGLPFSVAPGVLIPRPETEHLVEAALAAAKDYPQPKIVDIGCGSGAIAVALAHKLPQAKVTAVDISPAALAISLANASRNEVASRIRFVESDLFQGLAEESFDLIVSNPPYIPAGDRASLSVEVREHEPELALFAGDDGLDIYRRLIPEADARLSEGGYLLMEIGFGQHQAVERLLLESGFVSPLFLQDLQGIPRVAQGRKKSAGE